jgi:hypothetical protein
MSNVIDGSENTTSVPGVSQTAAGVDVRWRLEDRVMVAMFQFHANNLREKGDVAGESG